MVGYQAKECCAMDIVKPDNCTCRGKLLEIHNNAQEIDKGPSKKMWAERSLVYFYGQK